MKTVCLPNIIPASTVLNTTINSVACQLQESVAYSIQIVITGTPTGSFKLQSSDDPVAAATAVFLKSGLPINWTDIASSSQAVTAAGSIIWDKSWPGFNWVRAVYTDTSSGSSTAIVTISTFNSKSF
jgi:hypothetical protein